jgi:hypothetical protein
MTLDHQVAQQSANLEVLPKIGVADVPQLVIVLQIASMLALLLFR